MTDEDRTFKPAHAAPAPDPLLDGEEALFGGLPGDEAPAPAVPEAEVAPYLGAHAAPAPAHAAVPADEAPVALEALEDAPVPSPEETMPGAEMEPDPYEADTDPVMVPMTAGAPRDAEGASPATTAEIDVAAVEAKLSDPGSTQSFAPITEERINTDSTYDAGTTSALMWGARSDVGCVRTHNEDSYLVQSPLFCVSDGMGGHAAGEVASSIAVETIARTAPKSADAAALAAAVEAANAAIIEAAAAGLGKPGMGCTATCAYIEGSTVAIAHVGDSRCYLVHEGTLIKVTRDHSYVEELVDAGEITADEARVHPNRSVITRALGSDPGMYADHFQLTIEEGDRLILCSDGLSSMIPDREIESISQQSPTPQIAVDNLVDAALAAGGGDNVTVVVVDLVNDGRLERVIARRRRNVIIAAVTVVAALAIAAVAAFFAVTGSVFLGVHDGCVAIYQGIPEEVLGIDLYALSDATTIELDDLPEDTQSRLERGIPQGSMDEARATVSQYRRQIEQKQSEQIANAQAIRESESDGDASGASALTDTLAPTDAAGEDDA